MGNSTASMFWFFLLVIVIYIVGMSLYQLYMFIKKKKQDKKDRQFVNDNKR
ncbi:hypothetical protein [Anaerofustis butyriciformans]|uniref:hypothetical protein n=1 Tax=Anaerofustis butyriciformans TaxID=3108533 RepID=UPI002E350E0F|nr:hypothetical protein [Anaerofustis sp. HA2171]